MGHCSIVHAALTSICSCHSGLASCVTHQLLWRRGPASLVSETLLCVLVTSEAECWTVQSQAGSPAPQENDDAGPSSSGPYSGGAGVSPQQEDLLRECILLAACGANELLPQTPDLPGDVFTACLTTPIKASPLWSSAGF